MPIAALLEDVAWVLKSDYIGQVVVLMAEAQLEDWKLGLTPHLLGKSGASFRYGHNQAISARFPGNWKHSRSPCIMLNNPLS